MLGMDIAFYMGNTMDLYGIPVLEAVVVAQKKQNNHKLRILTFEALGPKGLAIRLQVGTEDPN